MDIKLLQAVLRTAEGNYHVAKRRSKGFRTPVLIEAERNLELVRQDYARAMAQLGGEANA